MKRIIDILEAMINGKRNVDLSKIEIILSALIISIFVVSTSFLFVDFMIS